MPPKERAQKRANRIAKERERLERNLSRSAPDASRETRQQVRAEGRRLDDRIAARQKAQARAAQQKKRSRVGESSEAAKKAARLSRGWFKRHENSAFVARQEAR